jgi:hypothetical protein
MEFKKLSDVEVVAEPAESANVLIEENGVIKKAPKTAVGGAGGNNTIVFSITNISAGEYGIVAPEGLYEKLTDMFNNNICIDIVSYIYSNDQFHRCTMDTLFRSGDIFEAWFGNSSTYHLKVYPNGTMDFYYDD